MNLPYYRKKHNLTQTELAKKTGMSTSAIAMYETKKRRPSLDKAKIIADVFGETIEEIFLNYKNHDKR